MKKVVFNVKSVDFEAKKFVDKTIIKIVPSTKTQNIASDEIRARGEIIASEVATDLFLNKTDVVNTLDGMLDIMGYKDEIKQGILNNMLDGLDRVCVFVKPKKD